MQAKSEVQAESGDVVVVHGHTTGDPGRTGVILEVLGTGSGHEHYDRFLVRDNRPDRVRGGAGIDRATADRSDTLLGVEHRELPRTSGTARP